MSKKLLFSLTAKDFEWSYFCTGGPGGQNQNRKKNGVACHHLPSGAYAQARDSKSQSDNKENAFKRCCENPKFQKWLKIEASRQLGNPTPEMLAEREVERLMNNPDDFVIEIQTGKHEWKKISLEDFLLLSTEERDAARVRQ